MHIELTSPACLLLGLVQQHGRTCQLGITLRYPQIQLLARSSGELSITGARADLAHRQAARFFERQQVPAQAEIEIDLAIPQFMGLGSAAMLGLSIARALSALHTLPDGDAMELARSVELADQEALEVHAFTQGGVLLVSDDGTLIDRKTITHQDESDDWVFVLVLPRTSSETPETLEADRRNALRTAAPHLGSETARIVTADLLLAIERDDIHAFAQALGQIQAQNHAALASAGQPLVLTQQEQLVFDIMNQHGALVCGRALSGLGLYGLIHGGGPSRELRRALVAQLGIFGGTVTATLCDNHGARQQNTK